MSTAATVVTLMSGVALGVARMLNRVSRYESTLTAPDDQVATERLRR
jgi:hypothetical protein